MQTTTSEQPPESAPPRIAPLTPAEWNEEQRALLERLHGEGVVYNVRGTFAQHWGAYQKFRVWAGHINGDTQTLSPREREILILRTGVAWGSEYEWRQHIAVARRVGLSDEEIRQIRVGPDAPGWKPHEAALLRAADELRASAEISDATWAQLRAHYSSHQQLMDIVFTVGHYSLVAMVLKTFRVPPDPKIPSL